MQAVLVFLYFSMKTCLWVVPLEAPQRVTSNEYYNILFRNKNNSKWIPHLELQTIYIYICKAVTIQSAHDTICIAILALRFSTYHDTTFMHKSEVGSFKTLGKQVQNHLRYPFLCNNACVR